MDSASLFPVALASAAVGAAVAIGVYAVRRRLRWKHRAEAYLLGFSYVLSENPDAAIAELAKAAELDDKTLDTYFALGVLFRRKGDLDRAIRLHQNMLLRPGLEPPARQRALLALGTDYRTAGLAGRAMETFEKVLADAPDDPEALLAMRQLREEAGDWEAAAQVQARLVRTTGQGQAILAHHLAGYARQRRATSAQEALNVADRGVELCATSADAHLARGEALLALGRRDDAWAALQRALELEPELAPRSLPLLREATRESAEAVEALLQVRAASSGPAALALALHQRDQGKSNAAIATLRALIERQPRLWEARKELGALLLADDRSDELRADYAQILGTLGQPPMGFLCAECRQKLVEHTFQCPACRAWDCVRREDGGTAKSAS